MMDKIDFENLEFDEYIVKDNFDRLDKYLSNLYPLWSRNYLQSIIKEGYVFVNDKNEKPSFKLNNLDKIVIYYKPILKLDVKAENIPLDIIYQDENIAIINKKAGMVVHPSAGHFSGTLVNAIMYHIGDLSSINGTYRPGIVHRIDKDTSGLIAIAKNNEAHNYLASQLKDHSMSRDYICLVKGILDSKKGLIKTLIGRDKKNRLKMAVVNDDGKEAITEFEVIETINDKYSLVKCHLLTGRTHQIRVHMDFINHPIINDPIYGVNNKINYDCAQLLHAYHLTLSSPKDHQIMEFEAPLPDFFKEVIEKLKNGEIK